MRREGVKGATGLVPWRGKGRSVTFVTVVFLGAKNCPVGPGPGGAPWRDLNTTCCKTSLQPRYMNLNLTESTPHIPEIIEKSTPLKDPPPPLEC